MALLPRHSYEVFRSARKTKAPSKIKNLLQFQGFRIKPNRIAELRSDSVSYLPLAVPTPLPHTTSAFLRLSWWSLCAGGRCQRFWLSNMFQLMITADSDLLMPRAVLAGGEGSWQVHTHPWMAALQCSGGRTRSRNLDKWGAGEPCVTRLEGNSMKRPETS